jgi:nucleotidyltransferase substrate binding protein (TIGR01987 family)
MSTKPTDNFEQTLKQLKAFVALPIQNDRDRAGIIQAFEFTFEQSWLSIQKIAGSMGQMTPSPKQAFTFGMSQGWILQSDEARWLQMIRDRNLTSHTYRQAIADEVLGRIQADYIELFDQLLKKLFGLKSI